MYHTLLENATIVALLCCPYGFPYAPLPIYTRVVVRYYALLNVCNRVNANFKPLLRNLADLGVISSVKNERIDYRGRGHLCSGGWSFFRWRRNGSVVATVGNGGRYGYCGHASRRFPLSFTHSISRRTLNISWLVFLAPICFGGSWKW